MFCQNTAASSPSFNAQHKSQRPRKEGTTTPTSSLAVSGLDMAYSFNKPTPSPPTFRLDVTCVATQRQSTERVAYMMMTCGKGCVFIWNREVLAQLL